MQFLKILFWCLLAFVAAVFTVGNWTTVTIKLWGGLVAEVNLPLMLFVAFLAGLLPTLLYHHTLRWRWSNRLATSERTVETLRTALAPVPVTPAVVMAMPITDPVPVPPPSGEA